MESETRLDVYPIERHDIVGDTQVVVIECVKVFVAYVNTVAKFLVYLVNDAGMASAVSVTVNYLYVTVALRVIVEA